MNVGKNVPRLVGDGAKYLVIKQSIASPENAHPVFAEKIFGIGDTDARAEIVAVGLIEARCVPLMSFLRTGSVSSRGSEKLFSINRFVSPTGVLYSYLSPRDSDKFGFTLHVS